MKFVKNYGFDHIIFIGERYADKPGFSLILAKLSDNSGRNLDFFQYISPMYFVFIFNYR